MNPELSDKIEDLAVDGLLVDGGHHKQWYLEQILKVLGVDLALLRAKLRTPDQNGDFYEWQDGIAP